MTRPDPQAASPRGEFLLSLLMLTAALALHPVLAAADSAEHLVVISNAEVVGKLDVKHENHAVEIVYRVDDNGRGPKVDEKLELDEHGRPLSWSIQGTSLFGASLDEAYQWKNGVASWHSQADQGEVAAPLPGMYIGGDASPWSLGLYARALLATPGQPLDVLPSGRMKLETLETLQLGAPAQPVTLYLLSGIQLEPQLLALDASGGLFASFDGRSGLVRAGFEDTLPRLQEWSRAFELKRLQGLQSELAHDFAVPVRYRNVRVFDPVAGRTGAPVSVVVHDGRIQAIDIDPLAGDPQTEAIVEGEGGTLVAGLYDMHSHTSMDTGLFYLAAGVTSTRDMGNDNAMLTEIRRASTAGEIAGPRITPAGMIEARSPYSVRLGIVAETLDEALAAVDWYAEHGYHEIKTYNSMNPEWVVPLVAEARRLGLGVTGHVPAFMNPDELIIDGYDAIAHINQLMLGWLLEPGEDTRTPLRLTAMKRAATLDLDDPKVKHTVQLMQEHGTSLDTTAVILERLMLSRAGQVQPGDLAYLSHVPIGYQRYRKRTFVPLPEAGDDAAYRAAFATLMRVLKLLYDNDIGLLIGTDDATGFTVHREMELYVEAGVPAPATLAIATLGAANYLGQQDELGSITPGKKADFLLVPGDPATDISAIRQIRLVSRGGTIYFPAEIYRAIGIEPFAQPVKISAPGAPPAGPSWFDPTRVDNAPVAAPVRTRHAGEYNGTRLKYDAIAGEIVLSGEDGQPAATMFSTAYVRTDKGAAPNRPVLFLFNGGPGASSSPLHLGIGPMRRPQDDTQGDALVPNPVSPIDSVDMVFIDPVGTGYTRLLRDGAGEQFWGIAPDADSVLLLIRGWLESNGRTDSPVFIMGESYGGTRAVAVAAQAQDVKIAGLLLLSPALDFSASEQVIGNNLPYMALLPSMAATAVYHGVVDGAGRSYLDVFNQAAQYAQSEYAAALYQGNTIDPDVKAAVARRLSELTGLPQAFIQESNLRIDQAEFRDRLLAPGAMRIGMLDARAKGPIADYKDQRPPGDDPSMGGPASAAKGGGGRSTGEVLDEYFSGQLDVHIDRPYRTLNLDLNSKWDYGQKGQLKTYFSVAPELQEAMQSDPELRVFVGGGVFDLATPIMAARYVTSQIDVAPDRFVFAGFEGGHTVFEHEASRIALCDDIRAFIRDTLAQPQSGQGE